VVHQAPNNARENVIVLIRHGIKKELFLLTVMFNLVNLLL
jgi:hypothetical protein